MDVAAFRIGAIVLGVILTFLFTLIVSILMDVKNSVKDLWSKFNEFPHMYVTQKTCDIRHKNAKNSKG